MTKSKYSNIFFDWSGVIADDSGDKFIQQSLRDIGANEIQIKDILNQHFNNFMIGNLSEADYWQVLKNEYGFDIPDQHSGVFDKWSDINPNKEMLRLVDRLKLSGYRVGLITNIIKPVFEIIKQSGNYDIFDDIVASCEVKLVKPDQQIYRLALDRLGATANESIFIDDKQSNLNAASKIGIKTILAKNSQQAILEIERATG